MVMEAHISSVENGFCNSTVGLNGGVLSVITVNITDEKVQ